MTNNIKNRDLIIKRLKEELIGPAPIGEEIDCSKPLVFGKAEEIYKSFVQAGSGEEILQRDSPLTRHGAGILYPVLPIKKEESNLDPNSTGKISFDNDDPSKSELFASEESISEVQSVEDDYQIGSNHLDLTGANKYSPTTMGVSFLAEIPKGGELIVNFSGGRYRPIIVTVAKKRREWFGRQPVQIKARFEGLDSLSAPGWITPSVIKSVNTDGLDLAVKLSVRPTKTSGQYLITAVVVNRTVVTNGLVQNQCAVFQSEFTVRVVSPKGNRHILPYPQGDYSEQTDEDRSIDLLYRRARTFAVGHGCSADWDKTVEEDEKVRQVVATSFPVFEVPSVTSDILGADGFPLNISMAKLAGLVPGDDGMPDLVEMVDGYEAWINRRENEIPKLLARYHHAANLHLAGCRTALGRMREGLDYLGQNPKAATAFRLANHAVLVQQKRSKIPLRLASVDGKTGKTSFSNPNKEPDLFDPNSQTGRWRGFQIAFFLMTLRSIVDPDCAERETVELLWYPTGGGKTEAYLGQTAFSLFYRRLVNPDDTGSHVFMRYTLRLLTAQQFQRAGALICAMESLRRLNEKALGKVEFSIGLWLGNEVTPGTRREALQALQRLENHPQAAENKFIVSRCPWCAAQLGKVETVHKKQKRSVSEKTTNILGYKKERGTVKFHCPDPSCLFGEQLPIYVIDEDLYANPPSLFIATVDKFAVLAWKPEARALFGIDKNGNRKVSPPGVKLVDELHLLVGPLGSMVGLYEVVVDELCTDYRDGKAVRPKIISSTATTRAYQSQIKSLFAREDAQMFPPHGLDAGNSFFARYARDEQGNLLPGRKYVGINAPGLGSLQNTEVRTYTTLLQTPSEFAPEERDPYWTLMVFFNNLKMLGNTISLFQANVPAYFLAYQNRTNQAKSRRIRHPLELTGQLRGDEVAAALVRLERIWKNSDSKAEDVCLCSSIFEVGVDVPRLSTLVIVRQPKTAAQYIQIGGRVGRNESSPGLIVVIYSPLSARDRSHFEHFRSFHERLYAQVEPMSVTPFSPPALERALHAVMAAYSRQTGSWKQAVTPYPFPTAQMKQFKNILLSRLQMIAPGMRREFENVFDRRVREWQLWERSSWSGGRCGDGEGSDALLRPFERWTEDADKDRSWATPVSMRNVDAESQLGITNFYQSADHSKKESEEV